MNGDLDIYVVKTNVDRSYDVRLHYFKDSMYVVFFVCGDEENMTSHPDWAPVMISLETNSHDFNILATRLKTLQFRCTSENPLLNPLLQMRIYPRRILRQSPMSRMNLLHRQIADHPLHTLCHVRCQDDLSRRTDEEHGAGKWDWFAGGFVDQGEVGG